MTSGREPRIKNAVPALPADAEVTYTARNSDRTQWTVRLEGITASTTVTVETISKPQVSLFVKQADVINVRLHSETANADPANASTYTFKVTINDQPTPPLSAKNPPKGPALTDDTKLPNGVNVRFTPSGETNTWIATLTGVDENMALTVESVNMRVVRFARDNNTSLVKLPSDTFNPVGIVFADPNNEFTLEDVLVENGYVPTLRVTRGSTDGVASNTTVEVIPENGSYTIKGSTGEYKNNAVVINVYVSATMNNEVQLVPQNTAIMAQGDAEILNGDHQVISNGTATFEISLNKGFYPVIEMTTDASGNPTNGAAVLNGVRLDEKAARLENNKVTWTVKVNVTKPGHMSLDCAALPAVTMGPLPAGVTIDETRTIVSAVDDATVDYAPKQFKASFVVEVAEDYKLLNDVLVQGWPLPSPVPNPNTYRVITKNSDGTYTIEVTSVDTEVTNATVSLRSEKLFYAQMLVPEELQEFVVAATCSMWMALLPSDSWLMRTGN